MYHAGFSICVKSFDSYCNPVRKGCYVGFTVVWLVGGGQPRAETQVARLKPQPLCPLPQIIARCAAQTGVPASPALARWRVHPAGVSVHPGKSVVFQD